MRPTNARRLSRAVLAGGLAAVVFAALASVGAAVSPSGVPAATAQYQEKVTICHKTGSKKNPFRTIRVAKSAVKAHLLHGDVEGTCGSAIFTVCKKVKGKAQKTVKVKGAKKVVKQLRRGGKLGKCKKPKKAKANAKKQDEKRKKAKKGRSSDDSGKQKGQAPENPGKSGDKGKKPR